MISLNGSNIILATATSGVVGVMSLHALIVALVVALCMASLFVFGNSCLKDMKND